MLSLTAMAHAGATITIVNQNSAGVGFNDATAATPVGGNSGTTIGAQRLIAFQFAANIWGAALDSTVEIRVHAKFEAQSCTATSGTLGSAGANQIISDFPNAEFASTWYHVALANKRAGSDQLPESHDINATFNSSIGTPGCLENSTGWYYGLDTNHGPTQINLVTVVLHELGHGLGFSQFASTSTGAQPQNLTDVYGRRLFDLTQNKFWFEMTDAERVQSAVNSRRVVWTGSTVTAAAASVLSAGTPLLRITSPPSVAGAYAVGDASFGAVLTATPVSGQLVLATDDANETGPTTTDACTTITNPSAINGKIAVVDRGVCTFVVKAQNVQTAGAIAMVVVDHTAGSPPPGLGGTDPNITIPAVRITLGDGNTIKAQLGNTVTGFVALDMNVRAGADDAGRLIMNAPNPVQPGSSISHWDPITSPSQLMEPNINDNLTHSVQAPQDLSLALMRDIGWTAAAVSGAGTFSPSALAFGNRLMGYGSFFHNINFSNSGTGTLSIVSIVVSGSAAFSRTHDCPGSLAVGVSCTVIVAYNPSSLVQQTGTLTITTDAPSSPHTMGITGTGIADLKFALTRPRRPARTGTGQALTTTFDLTITPAAGFIGEVELSCAGRDAGVSCTVRPGRVMVAGAPIAATLTVKVAGRSLRLRRLPVTETRMIKVTAVVEGVARSVAMPVEITR